MRARLSVQVECAPLHRVGADVAVAGVFADERPLRGGAGYADWRLCGWISRLASGARLRGERGEIALLSSHQRLVAPRLLLVGLGPRGTYGPEAQRDAVRQAIVCLLDLDVQSAAVDLPVPIVGQPRERVATAWLDGASQAVSSWHGRLLLRLVTGDASPSPWRRALEAALGEPREAHVTISLLAPSSEPATQTLRTAATSRPALQPRPT